MSLKIPEMQYDKRISKKEGKEILEFAEKYTKIFNDSMLERTLNKVNSTRFLGKGPFEIIKKRRENFSDDEIEDPEFFYVQKYKKTITKLVVIVEERFSSQENLNKFKDLLDFFTRQGYLTEKQMGLISYLSKNHPLIDHKSIPPTFKTKIDQTLHHHIKKDFMKAKSTTELAEILTETETETKQVIPKKKMFFSLSQIRNELSN